MANEDTWQLKLEFNFRVDLIWVGLILIWVDFFYWVGLIFWIGLLLNGYAMSYLVVNEKNISRQLKIVDVIILLTTYTPS
jgi:hypothetical protein